MYGVWPGKPSPRCHTTGNDIGLATETEFANFLEREKKWRQFGDNPCDNLRQLATTGDNYNLLSISSYDVGVFGQLLLDELFSPNKHLFTVYLYFPPRLHLNERLLKLLLRHARWSATGVPVTARPRTTPCATPFSLAS